MENQNITPDASGAIPWCGPNPTGCRSERPEHAVAREAARSWAGLEGGLNHKALLEMLEVNAVARRFSLRQRHVSYLRCIFQKLRPGDFAPGEQPPIVWMAKNRIADDLGVKPRAVSNLENDLACAGFLYWTDNASRRRDGWRDADTGRIACAFGVNLAPFAARAEEIGATFEAVQKERKASRALIYEISAARSRVLAQRKTAPPSGTAGGDSSLTELLDRARSLPTGRVMTGWNLGALQELAAKARLIEESMMTITSSEKDNRTTPPTNENLSEICSLGCTTESGSNTITNQLHDNSIVAAAPTAEASSRPDAAAAHPGPEREDSRRGAPPRSKAPPAWLILEALPRAFAAHMPDGPTPTSEEFQAAANRTRSYLGISPAAWREACRQLSPDGAALAIAVIAARAEAGELRSAGGYLRGMIKAARKQKLDLAKSLWGMVDRAADAESGAGLPAAAPCEPDLSEGSPEPSSLRDDPPPDEIHPGGERAPEDPHAPSLEVLEPLIPAGIRRRLPPHAGGRRRWLHLMHATMNECFQRLSIPGPAWREAMNTLGLHRTTAVGIAFAALMDGPPSLISSRPEIFFFQLVRHEENCPGSVNEHLELVRERDLGLAEFDAEFDRITSLMDIALSEVSRPDKGSEGHPS